ncbi:MAG: hypothetical protein AAF539_16610 [Planctomycetota bacterium]
MTIRSVRLMTLTITPMILSICLSNETVEAQGIQDLFARPESSISDYRPHEQSTRHLTETDTRPQRLAILDTLGQRIAQADTATNKISSPSDRRLQDDPGSAEARRWAMAMELRQARALRAAAEREARLEAARWSGSPTLRPSWNPDPFSASRFPNHHTFLVPAYIFR